MPLWPGRPGCCKPPLVTTRKSNKIQTSQIASGRPRIAQRRLQDCQEAQRDPNRTPKRTPDKPPNRRHIKEKCDMMSVQPVLKSLCQTHIIDMQNIVVCPLQRLRIDQIVSMSQRRTRTAPTTRFGALLGPLVPTYSRKVAHPGPQERPKIGLRGPHMPSWGRLRSALVPLGAF